MKLFKILLLCLALLPINASASEVVYETKNLEETLKDEAIEYDFSNYQETDDQITVYLFRGKGCQYCNNFLKFLNSIVEEYGKYFKLESYEVWVNKENSELFEKVSTFLEQDASGVPFIIIGDQVFPGYASGYDEAIKNAIVNLYNSEDRYDVFVEMEKAETKAKRDAIIKKGISILYDLALVGIGAGIVIFYNYKKDKKLNKRLDRIEKNIKEFQKDSKPKKAKITKSVKTQSNKKTKKISN